MRTGDAPTVHVNRRGAARWTQRQHPWIYRSDVVDAAGAEAGAVCVLDERNAVLGMALYSPVSTIALRMLTREARAIDAAFWRDRIAAAHAYRETLDIDASACRLVHAEADGLPSLVVDRYADVLTVQFLSAGLERYRADITAALVDALQPTGILARDDVPIRSHEQLAEGVTVLYGQVPDAIEVHETSVRWIADVRRGQKTGAFLDQRENRQRAGELARGRVLDCFAYHGSFALHLARTATHVTAVDSAADALARASLNAERNGFDNLEFVEANVFDFLRASEAAGDRYDVIVLDPPAFAKRRDAIDGALRGYKEINLRAMRVLAPGGHLCTFSCSWHVGRDRFQEMLAAAAMDAGRTMRWIEWRGQAHDHPEIVQIPETAYLKGAILQAV